MRGEFKLLIHMGNAAMSEPRDLAMALRGVAYQLQQGQTNGVVNDGNGNLVGGYMTKEEDDESDPAAG